LQFNQARHVVVVRRQPQHFGPPHAGRRHHRQGKKGQHGESLDLDAEALANRRQHTLHGLCRCPAQVQGQAEITKKKRQLRHGLFVHGDQSG
jgi:hypothetical protein